MSIITNVLNQTDKRREAKRFVKFSIVGALGAAIDFSLLYFLIFGVGMNSQVGKVIANIISTSIAIISNFTWNRLWTYPESRVRKKRTQLPQFTLVNLAGLILNTGIFYVADNWIFLPLFTSSVLNANQTGLPAETLAVLLAKATAIGLVLFWNFGINRIWTYRGL